MESLAQNLDHLTITSHPSSFTSSSSSSSVPAWILACFAERAADAKAAAINNHASQEEKEAEHDQMDLDIVDPILPRKTVLQSSSSSTPSDHFTQAVWGRVFNHRRDYSLTPHVHAVVHPRTTAEVIAVVEYAKATGKRVSVRSGGHSWAAWSVRGDAILVDLCELELPDTLKIDWFGHHGKYGCTERVMDDSAEREPAEACVWYDEESQVVACPPSMTGQELNDFLVWMGGSGKERMFAGGHCPDVGLGGFLLQGGMGWNCKNWGWACESVISMEVVTANGQHLLINNDSHPDLFWAARGAGPGFPAIVTRLYLRTRPLLEMYQSLYFYPVSLFKKVLQWAINIAPTCDPGMEIVCVSSHLRTSKNPYDPNPAKDSDYDPEPTILASFTLLTTSRSAALAALQPIHDLHPPGTKHLVFCQSTSLGQEYKQQLLASPWGHRYCCDNAYISNELSSSGPSSSSGFAAHETAESISVPDVLEKAFTTLPTVKSSALWFSMSPRSRRPLLDPQGEPMALSMQSDHYFAVYTVWSDEKDDERCTGWVRDIFKGVEKYAVGSYLGDADFRVRRARFWSDECARKLREVRKKWDPEGRMGGFCDDRKGDKEILRNGGGWV
ncbi:uncharacterized protein B0T23DRAFT_453618 [Neurospora hispaniola]|uniref:FAD-binding PCMH-type domain-containing protein n=1 Tax=Neurospora hispaniola TaxID=588809 RepID=A0AAJ0I7V0_9PEZI|nr:hypothetical protein B0T23DRAFT_453618 [Neurospora hispaniola]